jgi:hypothetical protein
MVRPSQKVPRRFPVSARSHFMVQIQRYVTYGAGRYVASGLYETRSAFFTSIDGLQWTEIPLDPFVPLLDRFL